jgi:hypothetical protein
MGEAVAVKSEALRDGRGLDPLLPPGIKIDLASIHALAISGGFLYPEGFAYVVA